MTMSSEFPYDPAGDPSAGEPHDAAALLRWLVGDDHPAGDPSSVYLAATQARGLLLEAAEQAQALRAQAVAALAGEGMSLAEIGVHLSLNRSTVQYLVGTGRAAHPAAIKENQ